jgi:hypothetical protein
VVIHNHSVINVNEAHQVEKTVFSSNIAIFDVYFPKLVGGSNPAIGCQAPGVFNLDPPLWRQYI